MTFGKEIKNLREKKGLKQYELAERLGIKTAYVCHIENGRRKPHSNTFIENVCQALDLTIGERLKLYSLSYNLPIPLSNSKQELLSQIANMELRDQLEAKEQMINELKEKLKIAIGDLHWIKEHSDKFDSSCSVEEQLDSIKSQCFATLYYLEGDKR